uniref:Sel1 repeat-containing protein n=1 Tax=Candidatus Kentrum sp. FM TaxID=2126340 RepID=A0A450TNH8_9GAMM|nr:MAG: hypothetical protein BECKFM1743A_GA0114220_100753 [Candidatus Kentron sp. FM]VFJ69350.1 MAG: hypothetical protein BECKFM1743C_GA0114222_105192 [Candidatus Kentron sp. FM]VFK18683.1 MAG: hypothetical protein BECKFM1743B_GA0114221_105662 [Candidatus Kentron sp. FM]
MHINQGIESRDESDPQKAGGRRWVRAALWIMIVALAGWYFLGENAQRQSRIENRNQSGISGVPSTMENNSLSAIHTPSMNDEPQKESLENPPLTDPSPAVITGKGVQAREMIEKIRDQGENADLKAVFNRAQQFRDEGMLVDAHLMYFFAAKQGHAESALVLGTMYDPEYALEVSSVIEEPDRVQAHKWYLRAAEGGSETAQQRLEYLRKQVERAAAKGDSEAGRLVLQWQ